MKKCAICGSENMVETHHVFFGPNRKLSEKYNMKIDLCHYHHQDHSQGIHHNKDFDICIKQIYQRKFIEHYPDLDFLKIFGKNYL